MYKWTIVEESLKDNRILNNLEIIKVRISNDENPENRWHIYNVYTSQEDIYELSKNIKPSWYMHFRQGNNIIAVFENKIFEFEISNKKTWDNAIKYWLSIWIPLEQLDFLTE